MADVQGSDLLGLQFILSRSWRMVSGPASIDTGSAPALREVRYECSASMIALLDQLRATLLLTTYQAGKLVAIGVYRGEITLSFHNFERPMGIARNQGSLAVGAHRQIWLLDEVPDIAPQIE